MKNAYLVLVFLAANLTVGKGQESPAQWTFGAETGFYFIPDEFFVLPVFRADKDHWHLEGRYNYEDQQTASAWFGYNLYGGDEFAFFITPMVGGVFGHTNGIAPGLEVTLGYKGFELYSEAEYLFDFDSADNNYLYNWADLTYAPLDWLWFGLSGQRTRTYDTGLDIQRGLILGGGWKNWEVSGYFYNPGTDDFFTMVAIGVSF
ncbi:MAG: hypothetical protein SFV52_08335 [Saprospiraceae bacterium]|nr:hypothetical protein [Saprospiraceae bacterium]